MHEGNPASCFERTDLSSLKGMSHSWSLLSMCLRFQSTAAKSQSIPIGICLELRAGWIRCARKLWLSMLNGRDSVCGCCDLGG